MQPLSCAASAHPAPPRGLWACRAPPPGAAPTFHLPRRLVPARAVKLQAPCCAPPAQHASPFAPEVSAAARELPSSSSRASSPALAALLESFPKLGSPSGGGGGGLSACGIQGGRQPGGAQQRSRPQGLPERPGGLSRKPPASPVKSSVLLYPAQFSSGAPYFGGIPLV